MTQFANITRMPGPTFGTFSIRQPANWVGALLKGSLGSNPVTCFAESGGLPLWRSQCRSLEHA